MLALMLMLGLLACAEGGIGGLSQLDGSRIGVQTGSSFDEMVRDALPNAQVEYYNGKADLVAALTGNKIDGFVVDEPVAQILMREDDRLAYLPEYLDEYDFGFVFPKNAAGEALRDQFNAFIVPLRADGTLDALAAKWFGEDESTKTMPDINALEAKNGTLRVATESGYAPFEYVRDGAVVGYDMELAIRFCEANGYGLEIVDMNYDAILSSVQAGKCDFAAAGISITPERAESVLFSEPNFSGGTVMVVLKGVAGAVQLEAITSLDQLSGRRIGIPSGTSFDLIVSKRLPKARLFYYNNQTDLLAALSANKIDAFPSDEPVIRYIMKQRPDIDYIPEYLDTFEFAYCFPKTDEGQALRDEFSAFIVDMKEDGRLDALAEKWFNADESGKTLPDLDALPAPNGTLVMATDGDYVPFEYVRDGAVVGYDVDLAAQFCQEYGYGLKIEVMNLDAVLPAVQSGKCDFAGSAITITPERAESVLFSEPNYAGGTVMAVLKDDGAQHAEKTVRWQDYNGRRIGILTGPLMEDAAKEYFPDSEALVFNGYPDLIAALLAGRIDGYLGDEPGVKSVHAEQPEIDYIHDRITQNNYSFAFRKNDPKSAALCDELNDFLARSWADGTMQELDDIWFGVDEDRKVVDMSDLTGENGTIRVVTTSTDMPFSYIKDGKNVGYDIDLVVRFCRDRGYKLELGDVDFTGRIPAIESGKYDFTTDMNVTPERQEQVLFSDPTSYGGIVLAVRSSDLASASVGPENAAGPEAMNGKRAGVITGSFHDSVVMEALPDSSISNYNSYSDLVAALKSDKIDYFLASAEVAGSLVEADDGLRVIPEPIRVLDIGAMFARDERGEQLKAQMDEFIEKMKADGTLDEIYAFWNDPANASTPVDQSGLTGENGTLRFATSGTKVPVSFVANGQIAGTDPDIAVRFCRAYGYDIEINVVDTAGIIPGIVSGTYDFSLSDMVITDERKESVNFSLPYHGTEMLIVTRQEAGAPASAAEAPREDGILSSFNKTFLREDRWKLFAEGVLTTLLITLLAILFGTALGFAVFMRCRNGDPVANAITRFCLWLVQGMPMVVLLMILYYVIFGSVAISGVAVAVIGFTLTFGAAVFGLLKMGVGAVDNGQYEAAYALGYSNRRTFYKIILPQALPHVLPAYKGEIVGLIKATAIVGYIAVQDLTKMGDIVRSRTYEAFFPLIAVTVIYFVLEGLLGFLVSRIGVNFNPKRRRPADILKGVNTDDQN